MAFTKRIGSLMSQSLTQNNVSMLNAVRYMSTKLFVAGISFQTDEHTLREAFSTYGEVTEAKIVTDRDTGRSRGFGFVNYSSEDAAKEALTEMDGLELDGRKLSVRVATERAPGGGGGGFNRGGYGGGGFGGGGGGGGGY